MGLVFDDRDGMGGNEFACRMVDFDLIVPWGNVLHGKSPLLPSQGEEGMVKDKDPTTH